MDTKELDFIVASEGRWYVYAKSSYFSLGYVEWSEQKKAYDYLPNSNGKLMKITQQEVCRQELIAFCKMKTEERQELGGNK